MGILKLLTLLMLTLSLVPIPAYAYTLPDLGNPDAQALTPQEEKKLGREFMQKIRDTVDLVGDPIISNYMENLGQLLLSHANNPSNKKLHVFVMQSNAIRAFAAPDGYIGVNSGLILITRTESELAAVIAHEIAHITQHHLERSLSQATATTVPIAAATAAALAVGVMVGGNAALNAGWGTAMGAMAGGTQYMLDFTRASEAEADHIGIEILYKAGFDPLAMPAFFGRLQQSNMDYNTDDIPPFFKTHPVVTTRIADTINRAARYSSYAHSVDLRHVVNTNNFNNAIFNDDLDHYFLVRARLQYFALQNKPNAVAYFKSRIAMQHHVHQMSNKEHDAARYAYFLVLMNARQWQDATTNLDVLLHNSPHEVIYLMAKAQLQIATKQNNAALMTLENTYREHKNYYPLAMQYAQTLAQFGHQPAKAQKVLQQQLQQPISDINKAITYVTLSEYAAKNNERANAYLYRAKALILFDDFPQATLLLQQALQLKNLSSNMRALFQAELDKVKHLAQVEK